MGECVVEKPMDVSSSVDVDLEKSLQYKMEGNEAYKEKNYEKAKKLYSLAIGCDSRNAVLYGNRAMTLILLGEFSTALEDSLTAVRIDDKFVKGYLRAGKCYLALGNVMQAMSTYHKVLEFEAKNAAAHQEIQLAIQVQKYLELANSNFEKGDFRSALHYWNQCLGCSPSSLKFKVMKAETLAMSGQYNDASILCNELLIKDRQNADAIYVKGVCFYYQDMSDRATKCFQQCLRLNPDHKPSQLILRKSKQLVNKKEEGNAAFKAGNYRAALNLYTEALKIDSCNRTTNSKLYCNRALVNSKLQKLEDAITDATLAIDLDDKYLKAYQRRAKCYQDNEQHEEAVRDLEKLCQLDLSRENRDLLQEGKRLLKLSKRKDYYKILGVSKSAGEMDVKRAYKKKALQYHPDRHANSTEAERNESERMFKEVGEAYGVLSDSKKKLRYDSGQDLEEMGGMGDIDPNQMFQAFFSGGGGGPFASFGGGGGGNSFTFGFAS